MLKYYFDLMSQPCRAIYILLKANNIPFQSCPVALRKGEHHDESFVKINPFKVVPAIDHDGYKLGESIAILRYLNREFPMEDKWYPKDSKSNALVDQFLEWQHLNLRFYEAMYFRTLVIDPVLKQQSPDKEKLAMLGKGLNEVLDKMEGIFLRDQPYLAGKHVTAADVFGACELEQAINVGYPAFKDRPKLKDWIERVRKDCGPHYTEAHTIVYKLKDRFAKL